MKSNKTLADNFIKLHLEKFGLNGTNTTQNPKANFPTFSHISNFNLKYADGVKFGYNGQFYNWRESSTCMFWVDYGMRQATRNRFVEEFLVSLDSTSKRWKKFSVPFFGSNFSQVLCELLLKTDFDYRISIPACSDCAELNFENEFDLKINSQLHFSEKIEKIVFRKEEFENFLQKMAEEVRSVDPHAGFATFIGIRSQYPHVFHSPWPHIRDENFDIFSGCPVGPSNWSFVDNECDFAIARYLMKENLDGVFNIFYTYPQIIFSFLNEASWRSWLQESSQLQNRKPSAEKFIADTFLREHFPSLYISDSWLQACEYLNQFKEELLVKCPKANETWLTPLNRLIRDLGIRYDFEFCQNEQVYGLVFDNSAEGS